MLPRLRRLAKPEDVLPRLLAVLLKRQPLHVAWYAGATGAQWLDVINVVARASTTTRTISRPGMVTLQRRFGFAASLFTDARSGARCRVRFCTAVPLQG